jgi:hypothetical protein
VEREFGCGVAGLDLGGSVCFCHKMGMGYAFGPSARAKRLDFFVVLD